MGDREKNIEEMRRLGQESLYFFCKGILGFDYMVPHVHGRLANFLQNSEWNRKQVTLPRGYLKTTSATIGYPMWSVLPERNGMKGKDPWHDPNHRILIEQNTIDNAMKRINMIKTLFEGNSLLQTLYPEIIPESFNKGRWSDQSAQIRRTQAHPEATFEAAGVGTATVSRHYTKIIEDDIIAAKKDDFTGDEAVPTREEVDKAIGLHKANNSILVNQKSGEIINVGTRWANFDVIQFIIDNQMPPYVRFEMSVWDKEGNPTYPERFDKEVLTQLKREQGTYIFSSQYENNPVNEENMVFPIDKIQEYSYEPDTSGMFVFMAVDPAISKKSKADFTSIMCAATTWDRKLYVLDYVRKKLDPSQQIEEILTMIHRRKPRVVYIETVAYQQALAHFTRIEASKRKIFAPVDDYNPGNQVAKPARIRGIQPIVMRGDLYIRPHFNELKQELRDFPYCLHDDLLDTLSIIVRKLTYPGSPAKLIVNDPQRELALMLKELRENGKSSLPFNSQVDWITPSTVSQLIR